MMRSSRDRAAKANFLDDLANVMVAARRNLGDQHGVMTMRRLNRREYRNTLRELLGVEIDVSELPSDTGTGGFDTVGSNLFMSGNQFEQYQALGREALDEAFELADRASVEKKRITKRRLREPIVTRFVAHQIDARERAQQWVKAVEEAAGGRRMRRSWPRSARNRKRRDLPALVGEDRRSTFAGSFGFDKRGRTMLIWPTIRWGRLAGLSPVLSPSSPRWTGAPILGRKPGIWLSSM